MSTTQLTRYCSKCHIEFSLEHFGKDSHGRDGLTSACKRCRKESQKTYKENHPEEYKASRRKTDYKRKDKKRIQAKERHRKHPEKRRDAAKRRRAKNPALYNANAREYRRNNVERMRELDRKSRAKDPEKRREQTKVSYHRTIEKRRDDDKKRRPLEREKRRVREQIRREEHGEAIRERQRKAREDNPEHFRKMQKAWAAAHPDKIRARGEKRRAQKYGNEATPLTRKEWEFIKATYDYRCVYCGKKPKQLTQDHLTPLSKGGRHVLTNIVPACRSCNSRKGDRAPLKPVQPLLGFVG